MDSESKFPAWMVLIKLRTCQRRRLRHVPKGGEEVKSPLRLNITGFLWFLLDVNSTITLRLLSNQFIYAVLMYI